jgi:uncharacterized membrane protein
VIDAILDGAAHHLVTVAHLGPEKPYANFTVADKGSVLDTFVKTSIVNLAKADQVDSAVEATRTAKQAEADTNLSIP